MFITDPIWLDDDPDGVLHVAYCEDEKDVEHFKDFPCWYFPVPRWATWLLRVTYWMFRAATNLCRRWHVKQSYHQSYQIDNKERE